MNRIQVLETAIELTKGDRNRDYGKPKDNMQQTADIFNAMTGHFITAQEVALLLAAVKLARIYTSPDKDDHYVDAAAYIGIAAECLEE